MTTEVWLGIIAVITSLVALVKYLVSALTKSNDSTVKSQAEHLKTFQEELLRIRKHYYETVSKLESLKAQLVSVQQGASENNKQLKRFIELTQTYIQDSEKRIRTLEDNLGKIIKVGK